MKTILQVITLVLWISVAHAAEPFDFKGVQLGATEQDLLEKHPEFSCKDDSVQVIGDRQCFGKNTYAGVEATIMIWFYSNQLGSVYISFDSAHFDDINSSLRTKYGKPSKIDKAYMSNAMGAKFLNEINTWKRKDGVLDLIKLAGGINESAVSIQSTSYNKEYTLRKKRKIKAGSGDM